MTYIVPNYFFEHNYKNLLKIDNLLCLNYITKHKDNSIYARTTMHSMVILLNGSKVVHLNGENLKVNSNEICFLAQNNYYLSERITDNTKYKSLIIYFDDNFVFDFVKKYKLKLTDDEKKNIIKVNYKNDALFKNCVESFQKYLDEVTDVNLLKLKIEEMFLHTLRVNEKTFYGHFNSIISTSQDRTKFILESNIDLIQSVEEMCNITRLPQSKLRRYIKKEYNTTPKVWLDSKRLEKATLMLTNSDKSISEISAICGYSTVSWFIAQFKKHYNLTPKDFRQKL